MDRDETADRIRARMAELRSELSYDVQDVGRSAREMTDVGLYVRRFPWATVAIALAAGYLLVPRKRQEVYPDPAVLAKLIEKNRIRVEATQNDTSPKHLLKSLAVMGLMTAARAGMNSVAERLASASARSPGAPNGERAPHESFRN